MKRVLIFSFLGLMMNSCGVDSDVLKYLDPEITISLTFPEKDSECTEGVLVSDTQSELVFEWSDDNNIGPYVVHLINNSTSETTLFDTENTELPIILERGVPYSWSVTGKSNNGSEQWSFYNAGPGLEFSVPLPATAISPVSGSSISQTSTTVNLVWKAEDFDDDIIGYDLYFGESENPPLYETDIVESIINGIPVNSEKIYYWKIVTKDSVGNESTSPIFVFTVG